MLQWLEKTNMKKILTFNIVLFFFINNTQAQLFGGQILNMGIEQQYPPSTFCTFPTVIVEVLNPVTNKIWMDRNLGASQVATISPSLGPGAPVDWGAFGDLYQWGRRSDGHQCRNNLNGWSNPPLSQLDQPQHGEIIECTLAPYDWRSPQNNNLWQGVNGINNPCPNGFRLPTATELNNERLSWGSNSSVGAFNSPLKFPIAEMHLHNGSLNIAMFYGCYWSSTINGTNAINLYFDGGSALNQINNRVNALSVRCIKN
jgi:hypothetical protein